MAPIKTVTPIIALFVANILPFKTWNLILEIDLFTINHYPDYSYSTKGVWIKKILNMNIISFVKVDKP